MARTYHRRAQVLLYALILCAFVAHATSTKLHPATEPAMTTTTTTAATLATRLARAEPEVPEKEVTDMAASSDLQDDDPDLHDDEPEFSVETFITIFVTLMIVLTNCAIIMVAAWTEAFSNFNKTFIYSLTFSDLLIGLFITPYSIFLSVYRKWVFASEKFCSVEAYVYTTLCVAKLYSLTWLSVDHYVAVRKPERYNVMMSSARSICWIAFSWVVAISFCCPPLFSFQSAIFNEATFICMIDSKQQIAYMLTAGVLASIPSLVALLITSAYLFTRAFKQRIQFYSKVFVELSSRPRNYHITFAMCVVFITVWLPFLVVFMYKQVTGSEVNASLQFYLCWLGMSSSFSQFFVLLLMSRDFRYALWEICQVPDWCQVCYSNRDSDSVNVNVITLPKK